MGLVDFCGPVIPAAPSVNGSPFGPGFVGDRHPAGPNVRGGRRWLEAVNDFFASAVLAGSNEYAFHFGAAVKLAIGKFHARVGLGGPDWPD